MRILNRDASWLRLMEVLPLRFQVGEPCLTLLQLLLGKYHLPYLEEKGKCHQENGYCSEYNKNLAVPDGIPRRNISTIIQQCSHILRLMVFYELL